MLTIKLRLKGKLEKNLTIRSVFRGKGIDTKLEKNLAYASFILYKINRKIISQSQKCPKSFSNKWIKFLTNLLFH